jgi:translation initiation factor 3 subunit F
VPFTERVDDLYVAISKDYHTSMYGFHRRNNKKEVIVGWYTTTTQNGEFIIDNSSLIHDFYAGECEYPIHLVVDTTLITDSISARGFVSKGVVFGDHVVANTFLEVKVDIELSEAESICLGHMIRGQENDEEDPCMISTLSSGVELTENAALKLLTVIDDVQGFVDDVVAGRVQPRRDIGIAIADALNACVPVTDNKSQQYSKGKIQDLLMVSYLSSLAQTQALISERLNQIL